MTGYFARGFQNLPHTHALPPAEIVRRRPTPCQQHIQALNMCIGQFHHRNIISYSRAIGGCIIISKYSHLLTLPQSHLQNNGDQMRLGIVIFTNQPRRIGTCGIKIAENNISSTSLSLGIEQHAFIHHFRNAIDIRGNF